MKKNMRLDIDLFTAVSGALSDPNRVRALMALRRGELCVCQIIELLKLAPSTVSKHMAVLKQAGLVDHRKDSRWVYYRLPDKKREGNFVGKLINLTISALKSDERVEDDNAKMIKITSEGLDALCKRKRGLSVFKDGGKFRGKNA